MREREALFFSLLATTGLPLSLSGFAGPCCVKPHRFPPFFAHGASRVRLRDTKGAIKLTRTGERRPRRTLQSADASCLLVARGEEIDIRSPQRGSTSANLSTSHLNLFFLSPSFLSSPSAFENSSSRPSTRTPPSASRRTS